MKVILRLDLFKYIYIFIMKFQYESHETDKYTFKEHYACETFSTLMSRKNVKNIGRVLLGNLLYFILQKIKNYKKQSFFFKLIKNQTTFFY